MSSGCLSLIYIKCNVFITLCASGSFVQQPWNVDITVAIFQTKKNWDSVQIRNASKISQVAATSESGFEHMAIWLHSHTQQMFTEGQPYAMTGFKMQSFPDFFLGTGSERLVSLQLQSQCYAHGSLHTSLLSDTTPLLYFLDVLFPGHVSSFLRPSAMPLCHTMSHGALTSFLRAKGCHG